LANLQPFSSKEGKRSGLSYGYVILLASLLIMIVAAGSQYSFSVFFKPVLTEFGWTRAAISGAYSLNMLLSGIMGVLTGRLCDRFGPRPVLTVSGIILGLGYLLMPQIQAIWQIYLFFGVIVSIGMSGMSIPLLSSAARWFSKRRSLATGVVMTGSGFGIVMMPPVANLLISNFNWRTSYIIIGSIALVLIVLLAQFLRRASSPDGSLNSDARVETTGNSSMQLQGLSFGEALRTWRLWLIFLMTFFIGFSMQTIMVHIVAYATDISISAAAAAFVVSVIGIVSIGGKLAMGGLGDRIGNRFIVIIVFILAVLAFLWLRFARELWMLYLFAAIFGLQYGGYSAVLSPLVAEYFGLKSHGAIFGLVMFAMGLGGAVGPLTAGRIFDIIGSYDWAFILCSIINVAGLLLSIVLKPAGSRQTELKQNY
jgi:MFS family permease